MEEKTSLSAEEIKTVATLLKKLSPGHLPHDIFIQTSRLTVLTTLELVPLRMRDGKVEVLLTERGDDDPVWGGMVHIPGTVILADDEKGNFADAIERVKQKELNGVEFDGQVMYISYVFHQTKRGREISFIHSVHLEQEAGGGKFYTVENFPENIVEHQIDYITEAARLFKIAQTA